MTHILTPSSTAKMRLVSVTLSRAHKINERINAKLTELRSQMSTKGQPVSVSAYLGAEQTDMITTGAAQALALIPVYVALTHAQASLRTVVAHANASTGVSDLLTKVEKNKRLMSLCDSVLSIAPTPNTMSIAALSTRPVGEQLKEYGSVSVSGIAASVAVPYAEAKAALERENFALQDQLSDMNAHKVSFEVAAEIIDLLSLTAY